MKKYLVLSFSFLLSVVSLKAQVEIVSAGTSAAYTLSVPGVFPLTNGIQVTFKAHTSCSASATMNVTGTGARSIMKEGNTVPLTGGDIKAGQIVTLAYDGTNWQMLSPIGNSATSSVNGTTNRVIKFTSASTGGDSQITDDGTNVGIGTSTPAHQLELFNTINSATPLAAIINGHANGDGALRFSGGATHYSIGSDNSDDAFKISNSAFGLGTTDRFTITSTGAVGIGTASPGATFEVFQSTNPQMRLKSSAGAGVVFDYNNTAFSILNYDNTPIYFGTGGGSTKMNIQSNGDVGIGTGVFTPSAKLHVIGNAIISSLVGPGTVVADASGLLSVVAGSSVTGTGTTNYLARWTSPTQLGIGATFDNGTSVGIGTPTPGKLAGATKYLTLAGTDAGITNATASLEIVGNTGATNTMASKVDFLGLDPGNATIPRARVEARSGNGATLAGQLLFYTNSNGSAANLIERMRIRESGEVGIGNAGIVSSLLSIGATNQFRVSTTGDLTRINDVPYTWPAANAAGFLSNNGSGTLTWSTAGVLAGGTTNYVPKWSSANALSSTSLIFDNGTTVGINTAAPSAASKLHVVGAGNGSTLNVDDNSLSNGSVLYLASTSTAGTASNNSRMITIARSGINANATHTAYGLQSTITNTGTTSTNIAGFFSASGATNNYAIIVPSTGGRVGIGTTAPTHSLTLTSSAGGATLQSINSFNTSGFASSLAFQKARGTEAAPAAVASGDDLGYLDFYGYNSGNASMQLGATISATSAQAFSVANAAGSNLVFSTAPLGTAGVVERMTVYYNGAVGIGATGIPTTSLLEVLGDVEIPAANDYSYTTAKTDYFSISSAGFNASPGAATNLDGFDSGNSRWFVGGTAGLAEFMYAPVHLPNGAVVTQVDFYVDDADATYQVIGRLDRHAFGGTVITNLATTVGSGAAFATGAATLTDNTIVNATVDNSLYSYFLRFETVQANANLKIYGAKITYTVLKVD
jgi:hypothetical protein